MQKTSYTQTFKKVKKILRTIDKRVFRKYMSLVCFIVYNLAIDIPILVLPVRSDEQTWPEFSAHLSQKMLNIPSPSLPLSLSLSLSPSLQ